MYHDMTIYRYIVASLTCMHAYIHTPIVTCMQMCIHLIVVTWERVHCLICMHDARGRASARGRVRTYQAMHSCLCYNYYVTLPAL